MIKVYPSVLDGEPLETHHAHGMSVEEWLVGNVKGFDPTLEAHPIAVSVDGRELAPGAWRGAMIYESTCVEIRVLPRKSAVNAVTSAISSVVSAAVSIVQQIFGFLMPSIPNVDRARQGRQGSSIYEPNAQANQPKLGAPIPEIAGQHKTFPDYLNSPRRYFVNTTTMAVDMMLCIGKGHYSVPDAQIRIGATPIQALGQSVNYQVFEPGQSVTSHQAHRRWYNAPEVGASLGASAGLRLKSTSDLASSLSASAVTLSGANVTIPSGAGTAPSDWEAGMLLEVKLFRDLEVIDGGEDGGDYLRDVLIGDFARLNLEPGDAVTIASLDGGPSGDYIVHSFTAGVDDDPDELTLSNVDLTPAAFLPIGFHLADIERTGVRYRIDAVLSNGFTLTKLTPSGVVDESWGGFGSRTTGDFDISLDGSNLDGNWAGPFLACPQGETTSVIEWDIFAPQGLGWVSERGGIDRWTREVELQWRPIGGGSWTSVRREISGATRDQLGWTFTVNLPSAITPEVRVRRTSKEDTRTQALNRLEWLGLRSRLPGAPTSYAGVTTLAITITGSDTIAGQTENKLSCVVTRLLPRFDSSSLEPTRSIADWVRYVANSAGYDDSDIDMDELRRLDATWDSRSDYFDYVHDDESTVKETLVRALRAGMAELTVDEGLLTPVRDEPRTQFDHMYTPQNMLAPLQRAVQTFRPDDVDGVDVEYFDAQTWTTETVECRLSGDQGRRVEKLRLDGVTNRTRAWRIGMRERRKMRYQRWAYSFSTELDALNSSYLSYCALADDIPGYAQSALVEGVEVDGPDVHLLSSEPLEWQTGKSHVVAWRRPDGTLAGPFPAQPGDDERHVIAQMDEVPVIDYRREPPHLLFGTTDEWSFPVLITSINPRGFESVSVDAVNYDERIYADDNGTPN